jgi:hypothetical protein
MHREICRGINSGDECGVGLSFKLGELFTLNDRLHSPEY